MRGPRCSGGPNQTNGGRRMRCLSATARMSIATAAFFLMPSTVRAQYDLDTCSGRLNYCTEWTRRGGGNNAQCEVAYQECLRTGVRPARRDLYNPYSGAAAQPAPSNPYPGAAERRDRNDPLVGPIDRQFCIGRVNCLPPR